MKYTTQIDINKPIDKVIELFDNPDNLKLWMKGLESFEHMSGEPGQPGAKSLLKFKMGKRELEMIETITVRNLPNEMSGTYEMHNTINHMKVSFVKLAENKTRYIYDSEFTFNSLGMKVFAFLMPGMFKKQSMKYLESFKQFAESQT